MVENIKIKDNEVSWQRHKEKFGRKIEYKSSLMNHGDYISVHTSMYVDGEIKSQDLVHIPIELIDVIKNLKEEQ